MFNRSRSEWISPPHYDLPEVWPLKLLGSVKGSMARAFVAVGSNIDPERNVREALRRLSSIVKIVGISTVYLSEALDRPEQPPYYNCVVGIDTDTPPVELKTLFGKIEEDLGRRRGPDRYAARTIDLDLIHFDDLVMKTDRITLPDPEILHRPFLAIPLHELAPDLTLPGLGTTIAQVVFGLPTKQIRPLNEYTNLLRKLLL
jgi:2-amino-4-hydroxy-6-hydroxymethyldihydropteridine diphosphokinase